MSSKFIYWKSVMYQTVWDATETVYDNGYRQVRSATPPPPSSVLGA